MGKVSKGGIFPRKRLDIPLFRVYNDHISGIGTGRVSSALPFFCFSYLSEKETIYGIRNRILWLSFL